MAYNLLDLTSSVQDDLKDPSFSSTRVRRYLNNGQRVIFNTHEFKFCEKPVSGTLTIGEYTYEQQSDHDLTIGGALIDPTNTGNYLLLNNKNYIGHREFFEKYPDPSAYTNAFPGYWTEFGDQIYFDCPVNKAYVFKQRYYRVPTDMSADADVPDVPVTFRELLELWALYRAEKYRGNHDVAATYRQDFEDGLESMGMKYGGVTSAGPVIWRNDMRKYNPRDDFYDSL